MAVALWSANSSAADRFGAGPGLGLPYASPHRSGLLMGMPPRNALDTVRYVASPDNGPSAGAPTISDTMAE